MFSFNNSVSKFKDWPNVEVIKQRTNQLELSCVETKSTNQNFYYLESKPYSINPELNVYLKAIFRRKDSNHDMEDACRCSWEIFFRFIVGNSQKKFQLYAISCSSSELQLSNSLYYTDNDSWYLVHKVKSNTLKFNVVFNSKTIMIENPLRNLYCEEYMTDLKLVGAGGSTVKVNSAVLAAQSEVMRQKIYEGDVKNEVLALEEFEKETLENFKKYIYLEEVPISNEDLKKLLHLATIASMTDLQMKCEKKLAKYM